MGKELLSIKTFGALKKSGYKSKSVKEELRQNLIKKLKNNTHTFEKIIGYENTVIPEFERAILSRHNIILLGLRGQAKTRMARQLTSLLDEYIPVIEGSEINDDPFNPLSIYARNLLEEKGDKTPIKWMHKEDRYGEKLATPDVSVADLIGDIDPIKAATQQLAYSDERVLHFGIIPRSHRGIFVINELPDLQPRIQVGLFNILQEGDIQIRGFKLRLPLDIQFVFTANPEDYTNRGSIVTPLKDRIESQILTHYPKTITLSKTITQQEAKILKAQEKRVNIIETAKDLIEEIAFEARKSEYVDSKSGVSARLTISAYESIISTAERRAIMNNDDQTFVRVSDFIGIIPAITGKIELVYEGEQEGPLVVAQSLLEKAIRKNFLNYFPDPKVIKKEKQKNIYAPIIQWFEAGNKIDLLYKLDEKSYKTTLDKVPQLNTIVKSFVSGITKDEQYFFMEFCLHGMAAHSLISKSVIDNVIQFEDLMGSMINMNDPEIDDLFSS